MEHKWIEAEKAFLEYRKELLSAAFDVKGEQLNRLERRLDRYFDEIGVEYEEFLVQAREYLKELAVRYKEFKKDSGLSDNQIEALLIATIADEHEKGEKAYEEGPEAYTQYCIDLITRLYNLSDEEKALLRGEIEAYARKWARFERRAKLKFAEIATEYERYKKVNQLTDARIRKLLHRYLAVRFAKANKAYRKYCAEVIKAEYNLNDEQLEKAAQALEDVVRRLEVRWAKYRLEAKRELRHCMRRYKVFKKASGLTDKQIAKLIKNIIEEYECYSYLSEE